MSLREQVLRAVQAQPDMTLEEIIAVVGEPTLSHTFMTTLIPDGVVSQWKPRPTSPTTGIDRDWQRIYTTRAHLMNLGGG